MNRKMTMICLAAMSLWGCVGPRINSGFRSYEDIFQFILETETAIGSGERLDDVPTLIELAAESSVEVYRLTSEGDDLPIYVIEPNVIRRGEGLSTFRGVKNGGPFYIFRVADHGFTYVGKMHGDRYEWITVNGYVGFKTLSAWSAFEALYTVYGWNGNSFEEVESYWTLGDKRMTREEIDAYWKVHAQKDRHNK